MEHNHRLKHNLATCCSSQFQMAKAHHGISASNFWRQPFRLPVMSLQEILDTKAWSSFSMCILEPKTICKHQWEKPCVCIYIYMHLCIHIHTDTYNYIYIYTWSYIIYVNSMPNISKNQRKRTWSSNLQLPTCQCRNLGLHRFHHWDCRRAGLRCKFAAGDVAGNTLNTLHGLVPWEDAWPGTKVLSLDSATKMPVSKGIQRGRKKPPLMNLCASRWVENGGK